MNILVYLGLKHDMEDQETKISNQSKKKEKRLETREHIPKVRAHYLLNFTFQAAKFFLRDGV